MAIPDLLKGSPLFMELFDKEVEKIVQDCSVITFNPGAVIVKDGDEGDEVFVMLLGESMVQKQTSEGVIKIQPLCQGDVFGEMVLFGNRMRSADIVATTECSVLEIPYDHIFSLFKKEPKIFALMILNLTRLVSKKLKFSNDLIVQLKEKKSAA